MVTAHVKTGTSEALQITSLDCVSGQGTVEVLEICGGRRVTVSLAQLGIRAGEMLRVRRAAPLGGAVLVETRERTVAIGRGVAHKVKVRIQS
jgi:Fe2+ transport system protein FeoA